MPEFPLLHEPNAPTVDLGDFQASWEWWHNCWQFKLSRYPLPFDSYQIGNLWMVRPDELNKEHADISFYDNLWIALEVDSTLTVGLKLETKTRSAMIAFAIAQYGDTFNLWCSIGDGIDYGVGPQMIDFIKQHGFKNMADYLFSPDPDPNADLTIWQRPKGGQA